MYVGQVAGTVVATIKHPAFVGRKLLLVERLDLDGQPTADYDICVDTVRAGVGDRVLVLDEGNGARQVLDLKVAPIRAVVVGYVDDVMLESSSNEDIEDLAIMAERANEPTIAHDQLVAELKAEGLLPN